MFCIVLGIIYRVCVFTQRMYRRSVYISKKYQNKRRSDAVSESLTFLLLAQLDTNVNQEQF